MVLSMKVSAPRINFFFNDSAPTEIYTTLHTLTLRVAGPKSRRTSPGRSEAYSPYAAATARLVQRRITARDAVFQEVWAYRTARIVAVFSFAVMKCGVVER
jgi:hypothetical protein